MYQESFIPIHQKLVDTVAQAEGADAIYIADTAIARVDELERAASGSWRGRHANVYYKDLQPVPIGLSYLYFARKPSLFPAMQHITGFDEPQYEFRASTSSKENWKHYSRESIDQYIFTDLDKASFESLNEIAEKCEQRFDQEKDRIISLLRLAAKHYDDLFSHHLADDLYSLYISSQADLIEEAKTKHENPTIKSNRVADNEDRIPPHIEVYAQAKWIRDSADRIKRLKVTAETAIEHISGLESLPEVGGAMSKERKNKIYIGYGQSNAWSRLKIHLEQELDQEVIHFTKGSAAGKINIDRLLEMVDEAAVAFLVMTGDDKLKDGKLHPRLNVVHEAGLFHSRLENQRVIMLLEIGCEKFSNVDGITYISFPKGKISHTYPEIEEFLKREELLESDS